jgi:hypothetical protein
MTKIVKLLAIALLFSLPLINTSAFSLPSTSINVGDPVYIENIDPEKFYAVFLPFKEPTNGEACASMSGEELTENNNLSDYGTCFVNDAGIFTIIEISEPFSSSYEDLVKVEGIIQETTVAVSENGEVYDNNENEEVITNLEQFIKDAEEEIKVILSSLTDTEESSESSSSEESVLGARTTNILGVMIDNYLVIALSILLSISLLVLLYVLKKDWNDHTDKK